ncbi:MAG: hypothetical protein GY950_29025 [bacterium]|nr:hypothetical protein [bacterium]
MKIQKISDEHFESTYWPTDRVDDAYPADDIDFDPRGAYSLYNWELFFHTPLFIAAQLSRNQKFEDAQKWFHFIFDPTRSEGVVPQRFWKTKPFYNYQKENYLEELQKCLNGEYGDLEYLVKQWQQNPFQPHLIARFRVVAYMKNVVMKYLDNLIAWGDMLFRRDSIESINEATQLYVLAAQILGKRPVCIESKDREPKTFAQLKSGENILEKVEVMFPAVSEKNKYSPPSKSIDILHSLLYFCLPENENLLGYWDTVADRLYKIRNCMNIEGVVRQLALFEPPIDPALLVKAAAAGVDIGSVLSDMKAPLPHYRFQHLLSKAVELCADVKTLGNSLLSALEKKDAEEMALLRSGHEIKIHEAMRAIKEKNIEEAETAIESLNKTKELAQIRHQYYTGREYMNSNEKLHLDKLESALVFQGIGQGLELLAGVLALIPQFKVGVAGAFGSPQVGVEIGGVQMSTAIQVASRVMSFISNIKNFEATKASIKGGYDRRQDDWGLQESLAAKEIEQIDIQIASAEIRKAIAEKDLQNQELQIENSKEVLDTMKNKYTNKQLYSWMTGQISGIYFQAYKMAYDMAKRAEKVFRFELGLTDSDYIQFGYWDSLKKGLLAGEKLHNDLKSLDIAFIEQNKREYEIGKHISMAMLNPLALVQLKEQGSCEVDIPEILFDLDYPGQYMRRIKSVSLTIPCVSGPYASVSCKLTLLQNRIRASVDTSSGYAYEGISDTRFIHNIIGIQSIAASSAQNDDGLFELNFRDERYLPFEGGGAVSTWRLELPSDFRAFDYNSISDVIIHMNYTAREGGDLLKTAVSGEMTDAVNNMLKDFEGNGTELLRVFSLKHEFSNDWHQLFSGPEQVATLKIETRHFPYIFHDWDLDLSGVTVFLQPKEGSVIDTGGLTFSIKGKAAGAWTDSVHGNLKEAEVALTGDPLGDWAVQAGGSGLDSGVLDNIYLLLRYTIKAS